MTRKFHASLNVSDIGRAVAFYRVLLGSEPVKHLADYAKFELEEPGLVLSLVPQSLSNGAGALNHAGLRVETSEELVDIQRRVEGAGFSTQREDGVECCYALQTKFWVADPDQTLWEIYVFHQDLPQRGAGFVPHIESAAKPRQKQRWQHQIPAAVPAEIPHASDSLDEVHLEGTINANADPSALFRDAYRAMRPGATLRVRGLAADVPLAGELPGLPGPAAVVERVPTALEVVGALTAAGFTNVQIEKLSAEAHFSVGGVGLREIIAHGRKPGFRPAKPTHEAIYLGPLAEIKDDYGNVFRRGQRVALNIHDWQVLSQGAAAGHFHFAALATSPTEGCCSGKQ